ncbi:MAG: GNAT family N-acetyltransferase [Burkholderiales bacterium]|nr:GNAT family N-acetyltransferase [Burkholderiales bacterium]
MPAFRLRDADWARDREALRAVRLAVFVREQCVPERLEWDASDAVSTHVLAEDEAGVPIGTGRLLPDGHIGRMAVLAQWRGQGIGDAMLSWLVAQARHRDMRQLRLHAQTHALAFYVRHGFTCVGEEFMEAGIAHRSMRRDI